MEERLHSGPLPVAQDKPVARRRVPWMEGAILLLALLVRFYALGAKPPHFDEGVNGTFVDTITATGFYHYDPTNFHGPLHFYLLFLSQTLLGRHAWALRLPVALFSVACVVLAMAYRPYLGRRATLWAALAMAISPALVFYGRYAIHETELLFFLMLAGWGLLGLAQTGGKRHLWATAAGLTGAILTKETYVIHFVAFYLGVRALLILEGLTLQQGLPCAQVAWKPRDLLLAVELSLLALVFFYSGGFMDLPGLPGMVTTFSTWVKTGTAHDGGHGKDWPYWLELMARYEWPALLGLLASAWFVLTSWRRSLRWLIISGAAAFTAYSLVRYKTPWCLVSILWPFFFVFGHAADRLVRFDRWLAAVALTLVLGHSAASMGLLNFRNATAENEPYVYVQTRNDLFKIMDPLEAAVRVDPARRHLSGYIVADLSDTHPLPWLLNDFSNIQFLAENQAQPEMDADFLYVADPFISDVESRLKERYFCERITLRGNGGEAANLYFRASAFDWYFLGRTPELTPALPPVPTPAAAPTPAVAP